MPSLPRTSGKMLDTGTVPHLRNDTRSPDPWQCGTDLPVKRQLYWGKGERGCHQAHAIRRAIARSSQSATATDAVISRLLLRSSPASRAGDTGANAYKQPVNPALQRGQQTFLIKGQTVSVSGSEGHIVCGHHSTLMLLH